MLNSRTLLGGLALAAFALAAGGTAIADDDDHEFRDRNDGLSLSSQKGFERASDDDDDDDRERSNRAYAVPDAGPAQFWRVTDALLDTDRRTLTLQHTVPIDAMQAYGEIANQGFAANGLRLQRVEGHYAQADVDLAAPHYHFTQWLRLP